MQKEGERQRTWTGQGLMAHGEGGVKDGLKVLDLET